MWTRVKGRTEDALLKLPIQAYSSAPASSQMDGIQSKALVYRKIFTVLRPLFPLLRRMFPNQVLSTRQIGHAMLNVTRRGNGKRVLEARGIRAAASI